MHDSIRVLSLSCQMCCFSLDTALQACASSPSRHVLMPGLRHTHMSALVRSDSPQQKIVDCDCVRPFFGAGACLSCLQRSLNCLHLWPLIK